MYNIAVFGGAGFIGQHLTKELISRNKIVTIFDIKPPPFLDDVTYIDLANLSVSELEHELSKVEGIIDLAYTTNPKTSFDNPVADILENLPNTVKLLNIVCKLDNIKRFVFVSSGGTVYGNTKSIKIDENHITIPISPYGITKLAIEQYGLMYYHTSDLPFVIARPANAYGIGQKINTGQGFIIHAINSIINDKPITIYGNKGTIRDYIYATDITSGLVDLIDNSMPGEAYNIGTGIGHSNIDIINMLQPFAKSIDKTIKIIHQPLRKFDVARNVLDSSRLNALTNWSPDIDLNSGLKTTWNWLVENNINKD